MTSRRFPVSLVPVLKPVIWLGGRHWWLSFLLWIVLVGPAQAATELRVAIKEGVSRVQVGTSTKAIVRDAAGQEIAQLEALNGFSAHGGGGSIELGKFHSSQLSIEPTDGGYVWIGDRWYRGRALLVPTSGGLIAVNVVDLEQYLYSVLGAEMSPDWPQEALKAQAVAARSYALYKRATAGNKIYDLGTTTKWQVYKGLETEGQGTHLAVDATSGQVMTYGGQIILAVFHASSGGHTENVENVWTGNYPYLRGVDDYDMGSPGFEWTKNFSRSELSNRISGVGNVISMTPEHTTPWGRIISMIVKGDRGTRRLSGNDLRSALSLKSTLFVVNPTENGFQLQGRGYGHGLGLSQWGAHNLAQKGINYQQILSHYYQNAILARIPEG